MKQICSNGDAASFVQGGSLYIFARDNKVKRVKLRVSKVEGRQCILAYTYLGNGSIVTYSSDFCLSLVRLKNDKKIRIGHKINES